MLYDGGSQVVFIAVQVVTGPLGCLLPNSLAGQALVDEEGLIEEVTVGNSNILWKQRQRKNHVLKPDKRYVSAVTLAQS